MLFLQQLEAGLVPLRALLTHSSGVCLYLERTRHCLSQHHIRMLEDAWDERARGWLEHHGFLKMSWSPQRKGGWATLGVLGAVSPGTQLPQDRDRLLPCHQQFPCPPSLQPALSNQQLPQRPEAVEPEQGWRGCGRQARAEFGRGLAWETASFLCKWILFGWLATWPWPEPLGKRTLHALNLFLASYTLPIYVNVLTEEGFLENSKPSAWPAPAPVGLSLCPPLTPSQVLSFGLLNSKWAGISDAQNLLGCDSGTFRATPFLNTVNWELVCSVTSVLSDSLRPPWTVAHQAPLSMEFSRQEYWSGLPCLPLGESSWPRDRTCVSYISCIAKWIFYH